MIEAASGAASRLIDEEPDETVRHLLIGQARVLELIARATPLPLVLDEIVRLIEQQAHGMICSVLLLSEDGRTVRHGSAPGLPEAYRRAVDGAQIGPCAGSCGTAAYTGRQVVVTDIAADPLWADYRQLVDLALAAGLRACWSTPIAATTGEVLGTFAIYYAERAAPTRTHQDLIAIATHLAGIAIERDAADRIRSRLVQRLEDTSRQNGLLLRSTERALRARDEFLALASHELKTPLTPLQLNLQSLHRLMTHAPGAVRASEVQEALAVAGRQVAQVLELVDDLLDVSRMTARALRLTLEPTDLGQLVREVDGARRDELARAGCSVQLDLEPGVVGRWDAARVRQALTKLLRNAMKYAPGTIQVSVRTRGAAALLSVRDHGSGIAPEDRERIFLPFERAVSYMSSSGFGLGLHVVRAIAEAHGGAVHLESAPGWGSAFTVELPLA